MITYKCSICKKEHIVPPYSGTFVFYNDKPFCTECLIDKRTNKRTKVDKWLPLVDDIDFKISILKEETENRIHDKVVLDQICEHIDKHYSASFLPKYFFVKLASIFDGTYKGLRQRIPADDLLDMWEQKQSWLDKTALKKWGNNQPEPIGRINYDLAILLGKYSNYLEWKAQKEAERAEQDNKPKEVSIPTSYFTVTQNNQSKDNDDMMAFMLEDLFD